MLPAPRSPLSGEGGFSLIEMLVAISLFAVVLATFTGVFISATRSIAEQRLRTAATRVASDRLETLRSLPPDQLDSQVGATTVTTPEGRTFTINTAITRIDAATAQEAVNGAVRQVTATVSWTFRGTARSVSHTTGITPQVTSEAAAARSIGAITMFPSPATVDSTGQPLQDIDVTVPLQGFEISSLVYLSWKNDGMADGALTLTSTTGLNWRGVITRDKIRAAIGPDGRGAVTFSVTAGNLVALYTLDVQVAVLSPPAITAASIDRNPITVAKPTGNRTCAAPNQCQNTTEMTFTVTATNLDPAQDSVILQYQLHDGSSQELPLTPAGGQWLLTVRQRTTKFLTGIDRRFRFTATRLADGATASTTVLRTVVAT